MIVEKINEWTTLIANIGVIAGVLVLAYQISENTQQMKDAALQQHDEMIGSWRMNMYSDQRLAELWHESYSGIDQLSEVERIRYSHMVIDFLQRHRTSYVAAKSSGHEAQMQMTVETAARAISQSRGVHGIWEPTGRRISQAIEPDFVLAVDRWIDENREKQ